MVVSYYSDTVIHCFKGSHKQEIATKKLASNEFVYIVCIVCIVGHCDHFLLTWDMNISRVGTRIGPYS